MSVTISKKYLKGKEQKSRFDWPEYIIAAPANAPELEGYVMRFREDRVDVSDTSITLKQGNEYKKSDYKMYFMFEKEVKIKGHPSKRYRYTEEEVLLLYRKGESKNFEGKVKERSEVSSKGPGRLVRASYTDYEHGKGKEPREGWFIAPDADPTWVYPFDYDPLRDEGKHNKNAKGFEVLEEYAVPDISVLRKDEYHLQHCLEAIKDNRGLCLNGIRSWEKSYSDKFGKIVNAESLTDEVALTAYEAVPKWIRTRRGPFNETEESQDGENLRLELTELATEMEEKCRAYVARHQKDNMEYLVKELKKSFGIDIDPHI